MQTVSINLSFQQLADAVKQLSPSDKIKLNEVIWSEDTAIPTQHQQIVESRISKSKQNPEMLLDWDEALKTL
jgi:hypothetical protein